MAEPRSVVVIGATSGIGQAIALRFAEEGFWVVVAGRNAVRGDAVRAACQAAQAPGALFVATDVAGHRTERIVEYIVDAAPVVDPGEDDGPAAAPVRPRLAATGTDGIITVAALGFGLTMLGGLALTVRRARRS